jgi:hypothetical protein
MKARRVWIAHATRLKSLFSSMSLSQNRCALLGDKHWLAGFASFIPRKPA